VHRTQRDNFMKSFKEYLKEGRQDLTKGWTFKNKIATSTNDYSYYHIQHVIKEPRKFGLDKKKILKIIEDSAKNMSVPNIEAYVEDQYESLGNGIVDNDVYIEEYLKKKGYCMFVVDKTHGSVQGWDEKSCKLGAKAVDDNYLPYERDGFKLFEIKPVKGRPKYITNKFDWNDFVEGKKASGSRSDIGNTMAQFREETELEEAEYQGRKVTLNEPFRTPGESKKFAVYTKNDKDKVVIVRFGDPNSEIKRDDPKRLKAYRSRMSCDDNPGPKWKANYWSCYQWRAGAKVDD